jgi:hypothetical protein
MESLNAVSLGSNQEQESGFVPAVNGGATKRVPSALGWFRILRAHYRWPLFEAIRYALWLAR